MEVSDVKKMKELEKENSRLKRIVANLTLENDVIKHVIEKKSAARRQTGGGDHYGYGETVKCWSGLQDIVITSFGDRRMSAN
jgi:hypothetical protein